MTTTRRDFVTIGTIGLLGAKQLLAQSTPLLGDAAAAANPILAVGYWNGLMIGAGAENPTSHIMSATSIGVDRAFSGASAMVTTYGFYRAPNNRAIPLSLSLIAFYPGIDPATKQKTPFVAWNIALSRSGMSGSLRSRFVVPVDRVNRIQLAVDRHDPQRVPLAGSDLDRIRALLDDPSSILSLGSSIGLERGIYFVALRDNDGQDVPDWTRLHVTELRATDRVKPDGDGILLDGGGNPVGFDYIVLKIDPYGVSDGRGDKVSADRRN